MSRWGWLATAVAATAVLTTLAIFAPVAIVAVVAGVGAIWWLARLDWWQRFFAIALTLLLGAMTRLDAIFVVTDYGRFASVALLLIATLAGAHRFPRVRLTATQRWLLAGLYSTLGLAAASILWSVRPQETIQQVAVFAMLPITIHSLMKHRWNNHDYMHADFRVAVQLLTFVFAAGLVLQYSGVFPAPGSRHYGVFANPNSVAAIGVIGAFLAWAVFVEKPSWWRAIPIALPVFCVIISESRTSFLALAAGALFIALRFSLRGRLAAVYASVVVAIVLLMTGANPLQPVIDRFLSNDGGDLLNTRGIAWSRVIELTTLQPRGYGWRTGEAAFASNRDAGFGFEADGVHNSYLQYILELGWAGLIPLIILVVTVLALAFSAPRRGFGAGLAGLLIAGLVVKVAESVMFGMGSAYPYLFWFAAAAVACLTAQSRVPPETAQAPRVRNVPTIHAPRVPHSAYPPPTV